MRAKKHIGILGVACLILSGALQGCVIVPLPASGKKVSYGTLIEQSDLEFIKPGVTTRAEVIQKLGAPAASYAEPDVIVYWWTRIVGYWGMVWGCGPGIAADRTEIERDEMLFVQFNECGLVRKFEIKRMPGSGAIATNFVANWARQNNHP